MKKTILEMANINQNNISSISGNLRFFRDSSGNSYHGGYVFITEATKNGIKEHALKVPYRYGYGEAQGEIAEYLGLDYDNKMRLCNNKALSITGAYGLKRELKALLVYADNLGYVEVKN